MGSANNVVGALAAYMIQGTAATNVSNVVDVKTSSRTATTSFDNILNKVSNNLVQSRTTDVSQKINQSLNEAKTTISKLDNKTARIDDNVVAAQGTQNVTDNSTQVRDIDEELQDAVTVAEETGATQGIGIELQEALTEAGNQMISNIAETFEISEEDVVNAMQVLGLMAADLLDPANLTQMVVQLSGQEETIDLITDTDIYTSLQDLMEGAESMKSELMNEFELSDEGLKAAIQDSRETFKEELDTQMVPEAPEEAEPKVKLEENSNMAQIPVEKTAEKTAETTENIQPKTEDTKTKAPQSEAFSDKPVAEEKKVEITTEQSKQGDNKNSFAHGEQSSNLFNQLVNNITNAATNNIESAQVSYTERAQMEDIIKQITEKITISAKPEETSMELTLHPASLGNVNILLTSGKDGIVAKFTAQNQIVKEAVEGQMIQLQQKFEEQGIKVTSIEVTIASHGFEQNLEQGNDRQPGEAQSDKKVKPLRRINLSELEDEEEIETVSDAERIARQMMAANGNMVDFSA